jgi:hypothetical protein
MNTLYLYLKDKEIHIEIGEIHLSYKAPICLRGFQSIISYKSGLITALCNVEYNDDTKEIEEDYIDVEDILNEYKYNAAEIINKITEIKLGEPGK